MTRPVAETLERGVQLYHSDDHKHRCSKPGSFPKPTNTTAILRFHLNQRHRSRA
uniref:Uncharacterized protein n=1 Tax=Anguilla anguilla TaxID=7936 RepID=A0A0E9W180_ANGAN